MVRRLVHLALLGHSGVHCRDRLGVRVVRHRDDRLGVLRHQDARLARHPGVHQTARLDAARPFRYWGDVRRRFRSVLRLGARCWAGMWELPTGHDPMPVLSLRLLLIVLSCLACCPLSGIDAGHVSAVFQTAAG